MTVQLCPVYAFSTASTKTEVLKQLHITLLTTDYHYEAKCILIENSGIGWTQSYDFDLQHQRCEN
jgi:hypothetical protein